MQYPSWKGLPMDCKEIPPETIWAVQCARDMFSVTQLGTGKAKQQGRARPAS